MRVIAGVMGAGEEAQARDVALAEELGERLAREGWIVLTGGRNAGVMAAAVRGAKRVEGSLTVGILPGESGETAPGLDVPVYTGLGEARNVVNILTSRVIITCGALNAGTLTEAALALKLRRPLVLLAPDEAAAAYFRTAGAALAETAAEAVLAAKSLLRA